MEKNSKLTEVGLLIGLAVLSVLAGFMVGRFVDSRTKNTPAEKTSAVTTNSSQAAVNQSSGLVNRGSSASGYDQKQVMPVVTDLGKPEYDKTAKAYRFSVTASVPSGDPLTYQLTDKSGNVLVSSSTGSFSGVSPSVDGTYYLQVVNSRSRDMKTTPQKVSGFDVQPEVVQPTVKKVTSQELAAKLNTGDYGSSFSKTWEREYMAPGYVVVCEGKKDGERAPESIGDICNRILMGTWSSLTVKSLSYDEFNRITRVRIVVNYPEE
jgi:hypothetical protein